MSGSKGHIYIILGKSATGKDSIYNAILREKSELKTYVMYTTRPMREGEEDGKTYHFVMPADIDRFKENGKLIEERIYNSVIGPWIYATVDDGLLDPTAGDYLIHGTLESFNKLKAYFGEDIVRPIYIEVDDKDRLLRSIYREAKEKHPRYKEICRRYLADEEDFCEEKIIEAGIKRRFRNDDLEACIKEITDSMNEENG